MKTICFYKKNVLKGAGSFLAALLILSDAHAQINDPEDDLFRSKMVVYARAHPTGLLFVHADKTIYTNNETIWFTAYMVKTQGVRLADHEVLSVALIKEDSRKVYIQHKYAMQNGLSYGSLSLPDSIPPGHYIFAAYTNVLDKTGQPIALFTQPLTLKSITQHSFNATLSLLDSVANGGMVRAKLVITNKDPGATVRQKATVEYSVGKAASRVATVEGTSYIINVPAAQLSQPRPVLLTSVRYNDEMQYVSLLLPGIPSQQVKKDTAYQLPEVLKNGVVIQLSDAVVDDSVRITLFSKEPRNVRVLIHNYKDIFVGFDIGIKPSGARAVVALPDLPRGIATITVLDEKRRLLAERLFFAHADQQLSTVIETDKAVYNKKEKVSVRLRLKDSAGNSAQGIVSIAVVQDNRIEYNAQQDIKTYTYLTHELGYPGRYGAGRLLSSKDDLENVLMVKVGRRHTWQSLMNSAPDDTLQKVQMPEMTARVKYNDKPVKKPVEVSIFSGSLFELDTTDAAGTLALAPKKIIVAEGKKVLLSVNEKNKDGYSIVVDDPFVPLNQKLSDEIEVSDRGAALQAEQNTADQALPGMERALLLQPVVVSAVKGNGLLYGAKANACGDYVCVSNILNCPNHFNDRANRPPEKGRIYRNGEITKLLKQTGKSIEALAREQGKTVQELVEIRYEGCTINNLVSGIEGIYIARDFYGVDTTQSAAAEPQFLSTLYWEPGSIIKSGGEKQFSFFTGDITGRFRIVVQGVGSTDMIFGEARFSVQ